MIPRSRVALLVLALLAASPAAAEPAGERALPPIPDTLIASAGYVSDAERDAFAFRRDQTRFMVAALMCREGGARALYNEFVVRFRPALRRNASVLKAFFARAYGAAAQRELDSFVTGFANEAALAQATRPGFCTRATERLERLISRGPETETAGASRPGPGGY